MKGYILFSLLLATSILTWRLLPLDVRAEVRAFLGSHLPWVVLGLLLLFACFLLVMTITPRLFGIEV